MQFMLEHPIFLVIIGILLVITAFVCFKASQASSRRYKRNEAIIKKLKEENLLRAEFSVLTPSLIESSDSAKLFKGVALNLQKRVADADDMNAEFNFLKPEEKGIYSLSFVAEDGAEKLSEFFKANGQPVTGTALSLFKELFEGKTAEIFEYEYNAFDEDNESVSVIPEEIEKHNSEFINLVSADDISKAGGNYIKQNAEKFI